MKMCKILFSILILVGNSAACFALTPKESVSEEYLINHGYSKESARMVTLQHKQINGEPTKTDIKPLRVRLLKKIHAYFDPAVDEEYFGDTKIQYDNYAKPVNL